MDWPRDESCPRLETASHEIDGVRKEKERLTAASDIICGQRSFKRHPSSMQHSSSLSRSFPVTSMTRDNKDGAGVEGVTRLLLENLLHLFLA